MRGNFIDVGKVATMFNTYSFNIYQKIKLGHFPKELYFSIGRKIYFDYEKLLKWIAADSLKKA